MIILPFIYYVCISTIFYIISRLFYNSKNPLLDIAFIFVIGGFPIKCVFSLPYFGGVMSGAFLNEVNIHAGLIFSILFLLIRKRRTMKISKQFALFILFFVISFFNPLNINSSAIFPVLFHLCEIFIFIFIVKECFSQDEIFSSLFSSLITLVLINTFLTICYPIFHMNKFLSLFYGDVSLEGSMRREGYDSAVGIYTHPSGLANVSSMCAIFFFANLILNRKHVNINSFFLFLSLFCLFFTYARTGYFLCIVCLCVTYAFVKRLRFRLKYVLIFFGLTICFYFSILYIPILNELFFSSNSEDMADARLAHWLLGFEIWEKSPLLGVGLNTHVFFMQKYFSVSALSDSFLFTNPIHNVHLQILAETGIVGLCFWLVWYCYSIKLCVKKVKMTSNISLLGYSIFASLLIYSFLYNFTGWSFFQYQTFCPFLILSYVLLPQKKVST